MTAIADLFAPPRVARPRLHARWVRALVIYGLSNAEVRERLLLDDLPAPSNAELDAIRAEWPPLAGLATASKRQVIASMRYLCRAEVFLWFYEDARETEKALALLRSSRAREVAEAALVCGVPYKLLVRMLASLVRFETTESALSLYQTSFFDTAHSRAQLRVLLRERVELSVLRASGLTPDDAVVQRAVRDDPRMLAASLPTGEGAWRAVVLSLGHLPPKRELAKLVDDLEQMTATRMHEALARGGAADARQADAFGGVLARLHTLKQDVNDPNDGLMAALSRIQIVQADVRMPHVRELIERGDQVATLEVGPREEVEVEP